MEPLIIADKSREIDVAIKDHVSKLQKAGRRRHYKNHVRCIRSIGPLPFLSQEILDQVVIIILPLPPLPPPPLSHDLLIHIVISSFIPIPPFVLAEFSGYNVLVTFSCYQLGLV